jgi:hypothetical protein
MDAKYIRHNHYMLPPPPPTGPHHWKRHTQIILDRGPWGCWTWDGGWVEWEELGWGPEWRVRRGAPGCLLPLWAKHLCFCLPDNMGSHCSKTVFSVEEIMACMFLCFVSDGTGVWTQALTFARQALYHLSHFASPVIFVSPSWLQTMIFLISASRVSRITGMSHQHLASLHSLNIWIFLL